MITVSLHLYDDHDQIHEVDVIAVPSKGDTLIFVNIHYSVIQTVHNIDKGEITVWIKKI